jgi:hypothetical protein
MKKFGFSGLNNLQSVNTNLVKVQNSNIKISHNILKVVKNFEVSKNHVFMDYSQDEDAMYLVILKNNNEAMIEQTSAKLLHEKYYTFSSASVAGFVGGPLTELDYVKDSKEEDEDFVYLKLKIVITGEEGRAKEKERKEKALAKESEKTSVEVEESDVSDLQQDNIEEVENVDLI